MNKKGMLIRILIELVIVVILLLLAKYLLCRYAGVFC